MDFYSLVRILLGAFFIFTSFSKIINPRGFQIVMASYRVLPRPLLILASYGIMLAELIIGLSLILDYYAQIILIIALIMQVVFIIALTKLLLEKKKLENCGCFGANIKMPLSWGKIIFDAIMIVITLALLIYS